MRRWERHAGALSAAVFFAACGGGRLPVVDAVQARDAGFLAAAPDGGPSQNPGKDGGSVVSNCSNTPPACVAALACGFGNFDPGPSTCVASPIPEQPKPRLVAVGRGSGLGSSIWVKSDGTAGPCDESLFTGGTLDHREQYRYDDSGQTLSHASFGPTGAARSITLNRYDACGRLVLTGFSDGGTFTPFEETDYAPNGLVARFSGGNGCGAYSFSEDCLGRVAHDLELPGCQIGHDYLYNDAGRLEVLTENQLSTPANAFSYPGRTKTEFHYWPNGSLASVSFDRSAYLNDQWENDYDEAGYLLHAATSSGGAMGMHGFSSTWTFGVDHQLRAYRSSAGAQDQTCGTDSTYDWDAGVLVHEHNRYLVNASGLPCPYQADEDISYTYPSPGIRLGVVQTADGGTVARERVVFDPRGNPIAIDEARPPDWTWQPVRRASYDGCTQ